MNDRTRPPSRDLVVFVVVTYAIAWVPFAPSLYGREPLPLVVLTPFAPAIAALWVVRRSRGGRMRALGFSPGGGTARLLPIALLWPLPVAILAGGLGRLTGATHGVGLLPGSDAGDVALMALVSVAISPVILGEELGWRGYLQPRIAPGRPLLAAVATGLIWGVWHYPLILTGSEPVADRLPTLAIMPISTISLSILLGRLRADAGSIWPATIAHAANNALSVTLISHAFTNGHEGLPTRAALPVLVAEAVVIVGLVVLLGPRGGGPTMAVRATVRSQRRESVRMSDGGHGTHTHPTPSHDRPRAPRDGRLPDRRGLRPPQPDPAG